MSFYNKIHEQVAGITNSYNYQNDGTAFGHFAIRECFSKIIEFDFDGSDLDQFIKDHLVDGSNDLGNDALFVNRKSNEILMFQFKYSESNLINTEEIRKNRKFIDWLLKLNETTLKPNYKVERIIDDEISQILTDENIAQQKFSIVLYYVGNNFDEKNISDIKALYESYQEKGINVIIRFYDYNDLENLFEDIDIPKNDIELSIVPEECFIKKANYFDRKTKTEIESKTEIETAVVSVKANSLKPIIEDKKELILALNVRYYKGENEINSKIKEEYNQGSKSNFWILNNGINAVCENFTIIEDKIRIKNFQIVNGGQTVKTLSRVVRDVPDEVQILMRLTKISEKMKISRVSMAIAVASNSQNAITPRDLHSGDRIQRHIFSKLNEKGIFYDKKDGEWGTVKDKRKYQNPKNTRTHLKINNTDVAKSFMSFFLQIPISTKGRNKLVFSEAYYDDIFSANVNEDKQFYKLMLSYRISRFVVKFKEKNQSNFEILQNTYINDVMIALAALHFYKGVLSIISSCDEVVSSFKEIDVKEFIDDNDNFALKPIKELEVFMLKIVNILQNILEVKQEAKKEYKNEKWIPIETNNWLKKDGTYNDIFKKIIIKLKQ